MKQPWIEIDAIPAIPDFASYVKKESLRFSLHDDKKNDRWREVRSRVADGVRYVSLKLHWRHPVPTSRRLYRDASRKRHGNRLAKAFPRETAIAKKCVRSGLENATRARQRGAYRGIDSRRYLPKCHCSVLRNLAARWRVSPHNHKRARSKSTNDLVSRRRRNDRERPQLRRNVTDDSLWRRGIEQKRSRFLSSRASFEVRVRSPGGHDADGKERENERNGEYVQSSPLGSQRSP